jgi:hypothetical protein
MLNTLFIRENAKDAKSAKPFSCVFVLFAFFADHKNICIYLRSSVDLINLCALRAFAVNNYLVPATL